MDIVRRALSWCWFLLRLKGTQSADAHVQKIPFLSWFEYPKTHVNRKWVAHPEHVNKCCGVRQILQVTITIIDPRLYQSTQFLCTTWNSPMNLFRESQTLTNTSVQRIIRGEKRNKVWIIVKGSRSRKLNLPNIYNLSSLIFQIIMYMFNHDLLWNVIDSFLLLFWSTKAISPAGRLHVSHLFFSCSFQYCV